MTVVELNDLGVVTKFLGIVFDYNAKTGWLFDHECVIVEILKEFGLSKLASVRVPLDGKDEEDVDAGRALLP